MSAPPTTVAADAQVDRAVVVVPARDEVELIGECLVALAEAARHARRRGVELRVVVVADECTDGTQERARATWRAHGCPGMLDILTTRARSVGAARRIGAAHGVASDPEPDRLWVLTTDADSRVPHDWVERQLVWAARGYDAVAGTVRLDHRHRLSASVRAHHEALLAAARLPHGRHSDVFGANLGVRAASLVTVGGFAPISLGEDHALWAALRRHGVRVVAPTDVVVTTSGRTRGRAKGGLADLLAAAPGGPDGSGLARP